MTSENQIKRDIITIMSHPGHSFTLTVENSVQRNILISKLNQDEVTTRCCGEVVHLIDHKLLLVEVGENKLELRFRLGQSQFEIDMTLNKVKKVIEDNLNFEALATI